MVLLEARDTHELVRGNELVQPADAGREHVIPANTVVLENLQVASTSGLGSFQVESKLGVRVTNVLGGVREAADVLAIAELIEVEIELGPRLRNVENLESQVVEWDVSGVGGILAGLSPVDESELVLSSLNLRFLRGDRDELAALQFLRPDPVDNSLGVLSAVAVEEYFEGDAALFHHLNFKLYTITQTLQRLSVVSLTTQIK